MYKLLIKKNQQKQKKLQKEFVFMYVKMLKMGHMFTDRKLCMVKGIIPHSMVLIMDMH